MKRWEVFPTSPLARSVAISKRSLTLSSSRELNGATITIRGLVWVRQGSKGKITRQFGGDPPSYVGLRTEWDWTVQFSLSWKPPIMMNPANEWGAIGIAASQYVQGAPGDLVYTLVNFWMDSNSSANVSPFAARIERSVGSPDVVVYHPVQIVGSGNQTITLDISPYLEDTIRVLGFPVVQSHPPVIPYVYLNVEGYNFGWNSTLWSFKLLTPIGGSVSGIPYMLVTGGLVVAVA